MECTNPTSITNRLKKKGRLLTYILRHKPSELGIELDSHGWASISSILDNLEIDLDELQCIVDSDDKNRFSFNTSKKLIRANQGHSIKIDLELEEKNTSYLSISRDC